MTLSHTLPSIPSPDIANAVNIHSFSLVTPLGTDYSTILSRALSLDTSGMRHNDSYLQGRHTVIGQVKDKLPSLVNTFSHFDYRANRLLALATEHIINDIDALKSKFHSSRIGIVLATSTAGVDSLENALPVYDTTGALPPYYQPHHQRMGSIATFLSHYLNISGPCMTVSTACSSANKAFASARRWINAGICDAVICGGVDVLSHLTLRGFESLGALSNEQSIPFSKNRAGINIGEGAGLFILTKGEGEFMIVGSGESSDAYHISAPHPEGDGAVNAIQLALQDAHLSPSHIDYINLHGTGTQHNDIMEANAIHRVFSDYAHNVPCSSSKPLIGHTLGVSGALELGLSLLSMSSTNSSGKYLPHYFDGNYDEDIKPLHLVPIDNTLGRPRYVLSNSFAFGGSNATIIIGRQ